MRNGFASITIACVVMAAIGGCGTGLPEPPKTADSRRVEVLPLDRMDPAEIDVVKAAESARFDYKYRLKILEAYYSRVGNIDKLLWVRREIENLADTQFFTWENQRVDLPVGESLEGADESMLVEEAVKARQVWVDSLTKLAEHYNLKQDTFHYNLIENVKARLDPVYIYMYFLDVEIPPETLRPTTMSPEAENLYEQAIQLKKQGVWSFPAERKRKHREALILLMKLITEHPNSTKIAMSAFAIADMYETTFGEYLRAVNWYQRAWQWDPDINRAARFRAAVVYDECLNDKQKAVETYRLVLKDENLNPINVHWANIRIKKITDPNS